MSEATVAPMDPHVAMQKAIMDQAIADQQEEDAQQQNASTQPAAVAAPSIPVRPLHPVGPRGIGSAINTQPTQDTPLSDVPGNAGQAGKAVGYGVGALGSGVMGAALEGFDTYDGFAPGREDRQWARDLVAPLRENHDAAMAATQEEIGAPGPFLTGLSQFATGMIGTGKLTEGLKVLPWIGKAADAAESYLSGNSLLAAGGKALATEAKAGFVSGTMFDPHQQRMSNLLVQYPMFNSTVTRYLASDPHDTDAEGRIKNVLEGLGLSAITGGLFLANVKLYKALSSGDREAITAATAEVQRAQVKAENGPDTNAPAEGGNPAAQADNTGSPGQQGPGPVVQDPLQGQAGEVPQVAPAKPRYSVSTGPDGTVTFTPKQFLDAAEGKSSSGDLTGTPGSPNDAATATVGGGLGDAAGTRRGGASSERNSGAGPGSLLAPNEVPSVGSGGDGRLVERPTGGDTRPLTGAVDSSLDHGGDVLDRDGSEPSVDGSGHSGPNDRPANQSSPRTADEAVGQSFDGALGDAAERPTDARSSRGTPSQTLTVVPNATEGLAQEGISGAKAKRPIDALSDGELDDILSRFDKDWAALDEHDGSWSDATSSGHKFATSPNTIPYQLMATPDDARALASRLVERRAKQFADLKGGDILSDARVQKLVDRWATAYNLDPSTIAGKLYQQGKDAPQAVALMDFGFKAANRIQADMTALAKRIDMGTSLPGDRDLLKQQAYLYQMYLAPANSILSNSGRALRRARSEFAPSGAYLRKLNGLDSDTMAGVIAKADGDPKKLQVLLNTSPWADASNIGKRFYVNNLLWGSGTHLANVLSNSYMALSRPAERILGSLGFGNAGSSVRQQAYRQYYFMGTSILDSFSNAVDALRSGDSILDPHAVELYRGVDTGPAAATVWKPWSGGNPLNMAQNATTAGLLAAKALDSWVLGAPTRFLGASDELFKNITYRSMVMSKASMEAQQQAASQGLEGATALKFVRDYIKSATDASFDDMGRALDMDALNESRVATFSQPLVGPEMSNFGKPVGRAIQNVANNVPLGWAALPFVKTPTNALRYSNKLSSLLAFAQKEFRESFEGRLGDTQEVRDRNQMQARGQLALGTSYMAAAGFLAYQGYITGAAPSDPKAEKDLRDTGWRPYSVRKLNADGSATYYPLSSRMDPLVLPMGIIADMVAAAQHPEGRNGLEGAATALGVALIKNITNRTYLMGLKQTLVAMTDPDRGFAGLAGNTASNLVPASSALKQVNGWIDPHLRDARAIMDKVLNTIPGFAQDLPIRRDTWGDPVSVPSIWSLTTDGHVDQEMERLTMDTEDGKSIAGLTPTKNGADLRQVTMVSGQNAWDHYQELAGHLPGQPPLKSIVGKIMDTPAYRAAPDGAARVKGTKLYMLGTKINKYHDAALKELKADPNVRKALYAANLAVQSAYAAKQRDPNGVIPQTQHLNNIIQNFGIPSVNPGPVVPQP